MKITQIEPLPVNVPLKQGLMTKTAHGEHVDSPYCLLRIHTDEGLIGLGEATLAPRWTGETSASCVAALEQIIGPAFVGQDPLQITRLRILMDRELKLNPFTKAAVEMALWDLAGKAVGKPVYELLGGKVREEVPIKLVVGAFPIPKAVELAERFLEMGVRCLKVKVGLNVAEDVARVRAVRAAAGPDIPIGIDANCGWSFADARRALRQLEANDILFAEQPIRQNDPLELAELRRETSIPIMADESVFTLSDAWQLGIHRSADILSVYPGKHGGIAGTREILNVGRAAGMVGSLGSNLELGIATAAMLHLAVAEPNLASEAFPADLIGPIYHDADMLTEPLHLGPPAARCPSGPGLGVELDEDQLKRYRAN